MTDDTVEGACILMNKIGYIIDERLKKEQEKGKETLNLKRLLEYNDVFKRFEDLQSEPKLSNRVQILIKNMLENKNTGWEKSKKESEKGPKKVEELRKEMVAKNKLEQEL